MSSPIPIQFQILNTGGMSNGNKWLFSFLVGVLAFIIFSAPLYRTTNSLFGNIGIGPLYINEGGATVKGLFIHSLVLFLLVRLILW